MIYFFNIRQWGLRKVQQLPWVSEPASGELQEADLGLGAHMFDEEPSYGPGDRGVNSRADFLVCLQAL